MKRTIAALLAVGWVVSCTAPSEDHSVVDAIIAMARSDGAVPEEAIVRLLGPGDYERKAIEDGYASYRYDGRNPGVLVTTVIVDNLPHGATTNPREQQQQVRFSFDGICLSADLVKQRSGVAFESNTRTVPVHHAGGDIELRQMTSGIRFNFAVWSKTSVLMMRDPSEGCSQWVSIAKAWSR
jgi:hypothetical protein